MAKPFVNPFVSGQFLELRVDALVSDGRGLGRHDGVVVLVEDALPGQLVRARVAAVRKSLLRKQAISFLHWTSRTHPQYWWRCQIPAYTSR